MSKPFDAQYEELNAALPDNTLMVLIGPAGSARLIGRLRGLPPRQLGCMMRAARITIDGQVEQLRAAAARLGGPEAVAGFDAGLNDATVQEHFRGFREEGRAT